MDRLTVALLASALVVTAAHSAMPSVQIRPDFSGTWTPVAPPELASLSGQEQTIRQDAASITFGHPSEGGSHATVCGFAASVTSQIAGTAVTCTATWQGMRLEIRQTWIRPDGSEERHTMTLGADEKGRLVMVTPGVADQATFERVYPPPASGLFEQAEFDVIAGARSMTVRGAHVAWRFFPVAGERSEIDQPRPVIGRFFTEPEFAASAARVVVLQYELWEELFGSPSEVLGRSLSVDGSPATVVGVAPIGFRHPSGARLWMPVTR